MLLMGLHYSEKSRMRFQRFLVEKWARKLKFVFLRMWMATACGCEVRLVKLQSFYLSSMCDQGYFKFLSLNLSFYKLN